MPFIDSKVTVKMSDDQKETLKSSLGQAITTMNKTESYLMVGINDGYLIRVHMWKSAYSVM